jgi:hypothetical protein
VREVPAGLFIVCCCLVLTLPVSLFLLTFIFRQSCALCGLPKPSVVAAAGIMSVNFVADAIALALLEAVVWEVARSLNVPRWESWIVTRFLDLPVDLAISSGLHAGLMGIKFGKGIEVWFVQRLIYLCIAAAVAFVAVLVMLIQAN